MTKPFSRSIAVGQAVAQDGSAVVFLVTDNERVAMSPRCARTVAAQLLRWAEHADEWKKLPPEERAQHWETIVSRALETEWRACEVVSAPPGETEHGAEETP